MSLRAKLEKHVALYYRCDTFVSHDYPASVTESQGLQARLKDEDSSSSIFVGSDGDEDYDTAALDTVNMTSLLSKPAPRRLRPKNLQMSTRLDHLSFISSASKLAENTAEQRCMSEYDAGFNERLTGAPTPALLRNSRRQTNAPLEVKKQPSDKTEQWEQSPTAVWDFRSNHDDDSEWTFMYETGHPPSPIKFARRKTPDLCFKTIVDPFMLMR